MHGCYRLLNLGRRHKLMVLMDGDVDMLHVERSPLIAVHLYCLLGDSPCVVVGFERTFRSQYYTCAQLKFNSDTRIA